MSYGRKKKIAFVMVGLYFFAGVAAEAVGNGEAYPVFSWRLFAKVRSVYDTHTIAIMQVGDTVFTPPLSFSETRFLFDQIDQSPTEYERFIHGLGVAIQSNDNKNIRRYRDQVEEIFSTDSYKYAVLRVQYDSLKYWKTGEYDSIEQLAVYTNK